MPTYDPPLNYGDRGSLTASCSCEHECWRHYRVDRTSDDPPCCDCLLRRDPHLPGPGECGCRLGPGWRLVHFNGRWRRVAGAWGQRNPAAAP